MHVSSCPYPGPIIGEYTYVTTLPDQASQLQQKYIRVFPWFAVLSHFKLRSASVKFNPRQGC